jgi:cytochrome c oxidase cbb3-type subunit 3/ubiquinol-cytochrome c reductase cytochrome c subunit
MKWCLLLTPAIFLPGCGSHVEQYTLPDQVTSFTALYGNNCAGCHGRDGRLGAARPLNDPAFLALIGKQKLREVIAGGVPKTAMPAFAKEAGGDLTEQQITILADQIDQRWSRPREFTTVALQPYSAELGDAKAGATVFRAHCASCHGEEGAGGPKAGSVVDSSYLALVSDQSLRSSVIAGRSDRGGPDWRSESPAHPLTPPEISNVVAWISEHRTPIHMTQRGTNLP